MKKYPTIRQLLSVAGKAYVKQSCIEHPSGAGQHILDAVNPKGQRTLKAIVTAIRKAMITAKEIK